MFASVVSVFLFILPLLSGQSADSDESLGWLRESRRDAKNKPKFTCYQGKFNSTERAPVLTKCVGKVCQRYTHIQSAYVVLSCKDFVEFGEKVGQCREIVDDQMPGQIDEICLCEGNLCNGDGRLRVPPSPLLLLLSLSLAVPTVLWFLPGAAV
ncbi:hypothetical protein niasHT_010299 [Heterodera trifolii]|uniref:Uncharacterized protein n=1 Tax=Heterodera trifolii TaxID=157864 RepID=A0ABD2M5Z7_9BILA